MNDSSALRLVDDARLLNVGELVASALRQSALEREREVEVFNSSTDNLPYLLEQCGARDDGAFAAVGSSKGIDGYSSVSRYDIRPCGGRGSIPHHRALASVGASRRSYATVREMLAVFLARKAELLSLFKRHRRLVSLGADYTNPTDAACLCLVGGKLVLRRIPISIHTRWRKTDLFVVRSSASL